MQVLQLSNFFVVKIFYSNIFLIYQKGNKIDLEDKREVKFEEG